MFYRQMRQIINKFVLTIIWYENQSLNLFKRLLKPKDDCLGLYIFSLTKSLRSLLSPFVLQKAVKSFNIQEFYCSESIRVLNADNYVESIPFDSCLTYKPLHIIS